MNPKKKSLLPNFNNWNWSYCSCTTHSSSNRLFLSRFICLLFLFSLIANITLGQQKVALLIGIGTYQDSAWPQLSSQNDICLLKDVLIAQGFQEEDILILEDEKATKVNILSCLNNLLDFVVENSFVYIHFSGHGQQMADNLGDEVDQLDESIVPYDAQREYHRGKYTGQNHIRDDELEFVLKKLRNKIGPSGQVLVSIDACHSGTSLRAKNIATVRGTEEIMAPKAYFKDLSSDFKKAESSFGLSNESPSQMASLIGIFASSPYQSNSECSVGGMKYGSLSYALAKALSNPTVLFNYETLFNRIRHTMAIKVPEQTPQIEGDLSTLTFDYSTNPPINYFRLINHKGKVDGGLAKGLTERSTVLVYQEDEINLKKATPFCTGVVIKSDLLTSVIKFDKDIQIDKYQGLKIVLNKRHYADTLRIKLDLEDERFFIARTNDKPAFQIINELPDLSIVKDINTGEYAVYEVSGKKVETSASPEGIWVFLNKYFTANFLRALEGESPRFEAVLELVNTKTNLPLTNANGQYHLKKGQPFKLRITNNGSRPFYFTALNIDAAHDLAVVCPFYYKNENQYKGKTPNDLFLQGKSCFTYDFPYSMEDPLGIDVIKLFVSDEPIDLSGLATRGDESWSALEYLYREILEFGPTRGEEESYKLPSGKVQVVTVIVNSY